MYLLHRPDIDEYKTIHAQDAEIFHDIVKNNMFDKEDEYGNVIRRQNNLELITDREQIRDVLDRKFSSRSRTSEYTHGLPSATVISSALFPMNIDYKQPQSKFNILRWWNNTSLEDMNAQKLKNKLSTDSGNFIHKIIEITFLSEDRNYVKKRSLDKYIQMACESPEIIQEINNFEDRKFYFVEMAQKTLAKFFNNEIEKIYPIFSEIFLRCKNIQGAIDGLLYKGGQLILGDIKTSKKSMSKNQVADKGYLRQLFLYREMLLEQKIITLSEYSSMAYEIFFFNWTSYNSTTYRFEKEDIDKCEAYCRFVLNWYWSIMSGNN
jgi:hypothetical protein